MQVASQLGMHSKRVLIYDIDGGQDVYKENYSLSGCE